jgi:hypothetical protein
MTPTGAGEFPGPPKNSLLWRGNFPAPARKIPCAARTGNLLQVIGNATSTHSGTIDSALNPKNSQPNSLRQGIKEPSLMLPAGSPDVRRFRISDTPQ